MIFSKCWKEKLLTSNVVYFRNEGKIETFQNKPKLKEFMATRPVLQEMLKRILQAETKRH
jgi:hypothetical protein